MADTSSAPKPVSRMATILAGAIVPVLLLDGSRLEVFVRQMPARFLIEKYMQYILNGREWEILEKVCKNVSGQPELEEGWVDALTDESHVALLQKAKELNFMRAAEQVARSKQDVDDLQPLNKQLTTSSPPTSPTPP
jgi:hypothetical protein